jgi:hypothetical protein
MSYHGANYLVDANGLTGLSGGRIGAYFYGFESFSYSSHGTAIGINAKVSMYVSSF